MRVLVCGGRDFHDKALLNHTLSNLHLNHPITALIEGDAQGADKLAGLWARKRKIPNLKFPAKWSVYGRSAGPIRNKQMLAEGKPDLVVAFPGGRGTANMVEQARRAGVWVITADEIDEAPRKIPLPRV